MNQFTYLTTHSLLFLLKTSQKLVSDNVLLLQHVILLFKVEVRFESLVEVLPCHLFLLTLELITFGFDSFKLYHKEALVVLKLASLICFLTLRLD